MNPKKLIGEGYSEMGEFWLTDSPESKIIGKITVGENEKVTLETFDDFPNCDIFNMMRSKINTKFEVIHGNTRSGFMVVLFNCIHLGNEIQASYMLRGHILPRHNNFADYKFDSAHVTYSNSSEWLGYTLMFDTSEYSDSGSISVKTRKAPVYKVKDCQVKLGYHWNSNSKESTLTSKNIFSFEFDDVKAISNVLEYLSIFGDFLLLCLNVPVVTEYICLGLGDAKDEIQLIGQQRNIQRKRKVGIGDLVAHWAIADDFQDILCGWFELGLDKEIRDALALYVESHFSKPAMEISFLILFQACEGIAKRVEPETFKDEKTEPLLKLMLKGTASPLLQFLDDAAIDILAHKMNATRKYWIHNSGRIKKDNTFKGRDLLAVSRLLAYSLRVYLLQKTGVSQETIRQCLSPYQGIGQFLLEDLKEICSPSGLPE
jgi:hypothetical protein